MTTQTFSPGPLDGQVPVPGTIIRTPGKGALWARQRQQYARFYRDLDTKYRHVVTVRFDDDCQNGHNTFSITSDIKRQARNNRWVDYRGGCCHEEVIKHFPRLAHMVKWHLVSSDGPMHYIANALHWREKYLETGPNHPAMIQQSKQFQDYWKSTVVYGACPDDARPVTAMGGELGESILQYGTSADMTKWLGERLPVLLKAFKRDIEALGMLWEPEGDKQP